MCKSCSPIGTRSIPIPIEGLVSRNGRKKSQTPYYECLQVYKHLSKDCTIKRINAEVLENALMDSVHLLADDEESLASVVTNASVGGGSTVEVRESLARTEQAIQTIDARLSRLLSTLESGCDAASISTIVSRMKQLESERKVLDQDSVDLRSKLISLQERTMTVEEASALLREMSDLFKRSDDETKKKIVNLIVKEVRVEPSNQATICIYWLPKVTHNLANGSPCASTAQHIVAGVAPCIPVSLAVV